MARSGTSVGGGRGGGADPTDVVCVVHPPPTLASVGAVGGDGAGHVMATFVVVRGGMTGESSVGRSICSTIR